MNNLYRLFIALLVSICFLGPSIRLSAQDSKDLTVFTNPLIGTKGIWFYGRTTPFVTPPFGMTHWTACTRPSRIAKGNYNYYDMHIIGFRASHKPAMWMGDYGFVTLKPTTGTVTEKSLKQKALYGHLHEVSKPYYYAVGITEPNLQNIHTEMTATERCGMLKFDFGKNQTPNVLIEASQLPDFNGWIKIDTAKDEVIGWNSDRQSSRLGPPLPNFKGYFVIQFDQAFDSWGTWENEVLKKDSTTQLANACGAWVTFGKNTRTVVARIGTSFISLEQARENLQKEIADATFEQIKEQTHQKWNEYLSRITIDGGNKNARHIFYSAMYHALLFPRQFSEYGRYYSAFDDKIHNNGA
jgi:predicted alpha-1,2-mannosidase